MAIDSAGAGAVPVCGTRYDALVERRERVPVYWPGPAQKIRRCSWFHKREPEGRWMPYEEAVAARLEEEYTAAWRSGSWQCKVVLDSSEQVILHSPEVMLHFPSSAPAPGALDDWGGVQPDPALSPQVVHRGLEGLPDIPDGETEEVDHLCFGILYSCF